MAQVTTNQLPKVPGDQGIGDKHSGGQPLPDLPGNLPPSRPGSDPVRMPTIPGYGGVTHTAGAMTGVPGGGDGGVYFGSVTNAIPITGHATDPHRLGVGGFGPGSDPVRMPTRPGSGGVTHTAGAMTGVPGGGNPLGPFRIRKTGESYEGLIINYGGIWHTTKTGAYEGVFSQELDPTGVGPGDPTHLKVSPQRLHDVTGIQPDFIGSPSRMPTRPAGGGVVQTAGAMTGASRLEPSDPISGRTRPRPGPRRIGRFSDENTTPGGPTDRRRRRGGGSY